MKELHLIKIGGRNYLMFATCMAEARFRAKHFGGILLTKKYPVEDYNLKLDVNKN